MKLSSFKRCRCRGEDGREFGQRCPQLRRADGSLNPRHGAWSWRIELPTDSTQESRKVIKRGAYATETEAEKAGKAVLELLSIPDAGAMGATARAEILKLVDRAANRGEAPPSADLIRRKVKTGVSIAREVTVGQFLPDWLAGKKDIRPTTWANYESNIRIYLIPHLGQIPLDRLRSAHVSAMFDAIDEENERIREVRRTGTPEERRQYRYRKPVGPAAKQRILACLRSALTDARRENLVEVNVAGGKLIKMESGKSPKALVWTRARVTRWQEIRAQIEGKQAERTAAIARADWATSKRLAVEIEALHEREKPSPVMVWTPAQLGRFLDFIADHRLYAMFHVIAFRGLRRGEACGVRWADLDLDEAVMTVAEQLYTVNWQVGTGRPKSDAGDRDVVLDKITVKALRLHRKQQREDRIAWGSAWVNSGRIFTREDGSELHPAMVTELFTTLAGAAGLPPIRLHDLRHGAASIAKAGGVDTTVISKQLGHSSRKITDDLYTSIFEELATDAAEATAAIVPRAVAVGGAGDGRPDGLRLVSNEPNRKATPGRQWNERAGKRGIEESRHRDSNPEPPDYKSR